MGALPNIKSEDAYRLASRLAELTGDGLTTVVTGRCGLSLRVKSVPATAMSGGAVYARSSRTLLAVILNEEDEPRFAAAMVDVPTLLISAANWVETAVVIASHPAAVV